MSLTTAPYIGRIASTRRGLIGRIAVRIARQRVARMRPVATAIVERDTREMIRAEFDQLADELITELNQTTPVEETIMVLYPETMISHPRF